MNCTKSDGEIGKIPISKIGWRAWQNRMDSKNQTDFGFSCKQGVMPHTACLVCLVSTVSGLHKNALGRGRASSKHITKLEQSTFLKISMNFFLQPLAQHSKRENFESAVFEQKLMLSSSFRCRQIHYCHRYYFGHTL